MLHGHALEDRIVAAYPAPIAVPYRAMTDQQAPAASFGCLLTAVDGLASFLAAVVASTYARSSLASPECDRALRSALRHERLTAGALVGLFRDLLRHGGDELGARLPYPLREHFLPSGRPSASLSALDELVALRSRACDASSESLLPDARARLDAELSALEVLATWTLVRPVSARTEGGRTTIERADLLMGDRRLRGRPFELALAPGELDVDGGDVRIEKTLLLASPDRERYLPLSPMALYPVRLRGQGVFFLQRADWSAHRRGALRRATYVAYEPGLGEHEERAGEPAAAALERLVARLGTEPAEPSSAMSDEQPGAELAEVWLEQAHHVAGFIGREALLAELARGVDEREGYTLLLGGPGQGKSAIVAELARREQERGGALLHMVKSHRSPSRFVPSLVAQAARLSGSAIELRDPGDEDDLRDALVRALTALQAARGRAVLLIDALDELDAAGRRLAFLPSQLPHGARVILSCRPDAPLVETLRSRVAPLEEREVPPLAPDEAEALIASRLGPRAAEVDLRAILERAKGSPLLLTRAVGALARWAEDGGDEPFDLERVPATIDALFETIYAELAEKQGGRSTSEEGRDKARLLQLLAVAREPLGVEELGALLRIGRDPSRPQLTLEDVRDRVREMSAYLIDLGGERFVPWHQGLSDHVRERVLGPDGAREVEGAFAEWTARGGPYALRHRVAHLVAAGRADEAAALLADPEQLEARVEAGMVHDLSRDFALALAEAPADRAPLLARLAEIVRRHGAFLARWPSALFGVMHDAAFWHDTPAVAAWYAPAPPKRAPLLSSWIADWRERRRDPWLRTLRPPEERLDDALRAQLRGHEGGADAVAFSPDGTLLASAGRDGFARLWDVATAVPLAAVRATAAGRVRAVAFAPDGGGFVTGGDDGTLRLWDLDGHERLRGDAHGAAICAVAIAPDGGRFASGGRDRALQIWEHGARARARTTSGAVGAVAFSPDGARVAAAVAISRLLVWNLDEDAIEIDREVPYSIEALAYRPDGALVLGYSDAIVRVLARDGEVIEEVDLRDERRLWALAVSAGGVIACGGSSGRTWCLHRGGERSARRAHGAGLRAVAFSPDGETIASAYDDGTLRLWDARDVVAPKVRGDRSRVACALFSRDGERLAIGGHDGALRIWRTADPLSEETLAPHAGAVLALACSPDDRLLASASLDGTARVYNRAGRAIASLATHEAAVRAVAFTPDGTGVVTGSRDHTARLYSLFGSRERRVFPHEEGVVAVAVSRDGRVVHVAGKSGSLAAWALDGERLWSARLALAAAPVAMASSADGAIVALALADGSAGVWADGAWTAAPHAELDALVGVAPEPELVVRSSDRETVVRRAADGSAVAAFPVALPHLVASPSGRHWAGWRREHVHLLALER